LHLGAEIATNKNNTSFLGHEPNFTEQGLSISQVAITLWVLHTIVV
jgi:hypothetical protein